MSLKYRDSQGTETPVAGLNGTSGELVPSVSLYQSGYLNLVNLTPEYSGVTQLDIEHPSVQYRVTFATPFPDANYVVICDSHNTNLQIEVASAGFSANGFVVTVRNLVATIRDDRGETADGFVYTLIDDYFHWTAFKLMTDTVHEADSAHIAQNTANFAPAFSTTTSYAVGDYVTYNNILYRCTTAHTAGVWVAGHFTAVTVGEDLSAIVPSDASASNKLVSTNTLNGWKGVNDVSSAYKFTRTAVKGGCALFSDVFGNTYIVSSGDQSSRFSVRQINVVGNNDSTKYWVGNEVCYISANVFSLTLIAVFGSLNYEAISSHISTAPTGTTESTISTSIPIDTVTSGSTAPVTSGGVYDAIVKRYPTGSLYPVNLGLAVGTVTLEDLCDAINTTLGSDCCIHFSWDSSSAIALDVNGTIVSLAGSVLQGHFEPKNTPWRLSEGWFTDEEGNMYSFRCRTQGGTTPSIAIKKLS